MEACGCLGGHGKLRASMGDAWLCGVPVPWGCGEPGSGAVIRVGAGAVARSARRGGVLGSSEDRCPGRVACRAVRRG